MTINGKNTEIIQKLKTCFHKLNWFMKLFFPRTVAEILEQLSADSSIPISLEFGRSIFSALATQTFFKPWAWLWLSQSDFQHLKTVLNCIVEEQLSDRNDIHTINKMNLLLVCQNPEVSLKVYAILQSVDLIRPSNLALISSHPNLPQLLMSLERLQQLEMLTQNNIDTFSNQQNFNRMEDIKLLEEANIDNKVYREAILLCDKNYSFYLATALTLLHQANKLPLGENFDSHFLTLVLFKDIIGYLREFDAIELSDRSGYRFPPGPRPFIMENLSTIAYHSNPGLLCSVFKTLLQITYQKTGMGRALFSQQRLNTLFNHPDLHALKAALFCLNQAHSPDGSRVRYSHSDIDMLFAHSHLLSLITIMQVLAKNRLLTPENLNKLLSHPQPEGINFLFQIELAHAVNFTQRAFDVICDEAYGTSASTALPEIMIESSMASEMLEQKLPESITDTTTIGIDNLEQYPELLRFIQARNYPDRASSIGSLKQYYRIHLTILNGSPESPAFLKKPINPDGGIHNGSPLMQEDGYINFVTPMAICVILGLGPAMLALYMRERGSPAWSNERLLSWSVASGHLDITKTLLSLPRFMDTLIEPTRGEWDWNRFLGNWLLETALEGQHFELFNTLLQYPPIYKEFLSERSSVWLLQSAVATGKVSVLNYLLSFQNIQNEIPKFKEELCRESMKIDSLVMFERLIEIPPSNRLGRSETADILEVATQYNSLQIINYILVSPHFSPLQIGQYLERLVEKCMRSNVSDAVRTRLLQVPAVFACAEKHDNEYSQQTYPFITDRLKDLHEQKSALEIQDTHAVFDVEANEAQLLFYILRNLIRHNSPESQDEIRFLLSIPAVKRLAHTAVTPNEPNELLRFAMTTDNPEAAAILLTIPAVRALASEHNFYRNEVRGHFDLRAVAEDRESSMRALSTGEQRRLSAAIERYQPSINAKGVASLFQELTRQLITRYEAYPAQVHTGDGRVIDLPTSWEEWRKIGSTFSAETQENALQAYYKHKDHTALRYLSRPNDWLAPHALYADHINRCSTFEEYKPLITMLYLAARDKDIAPTDGFTLESRLDHFIDELAHLGRAHNWDQTRIRTDAAGDPLLDEDGNIIAEEFDDGRGDNPSCYSGVKRRLFQSVLGHPLLKILTLDDIKQEIRDFVREYFKQGIHDGNRDRIRYAWENLCETGVYNERTHACLNELNVPLELQTSLVQRLSEKYPTQFNDEPYFKKHIEASFQTNKIFPVHLMRFASEASLEALLQENSLAQAVQKPQKMSSNQDIHRAKARLTHFGSLGDAVIAEIICLQRGVMSTWSTIWAKSHEKLADILTAVHALAEDLSTMQLSIILADPQSNLSKALAMPLSNTISNSNSEADATILENINTALRNFNQESLTL